MALNFKKDRFIRILTGRVTQNLYDERKNKVVPLFVDLSRKLQFIRENPGSSVTGESIPHPRLAENEDKFVNLQEEFQRIELLARTDLKQACEDLEAVKLQARALDALLSTDVAGIARSKDESDDVSVLESDTEHTTDNLSKIATAALLALNTLQARVNDLPSRNKTTKDRINREITVCQFQLNDVNDTLLALATETNVKTIKKVSANAKKSYQGLLKACNKINTQLDDLASNELETDIELNGKQVRLDKRSMPGLEDLSEEEQRRVQAQVSAKIVAGKKKVESILSKSIEELEEPSRKDIADVMWYLKTLAEQSVGEPHEKGAINLPDPDGTIIAWLDKAAEVYTRASSHMTARQVGGAGQARGIDFYDGDVSSREKTDLLLPYGMNTLLAQSFEIGGEKRLYLKTETEGSPTSPARTVIPTICGGLGMITGGVVGGILGCLVLSPKKGAKVGANFGQDALATLGGLPLDILTVGGKLSDKIFRKEGAPPSRATYFTDNAKAVRHGLNLFGGTHDTMAGYRETFKGSKGLSGDELKHPIKSIWGEMISDLKTAEDARILGLATQMGLQKVKFGVTLKDGIAELNQMITAIETAQRVLGEILDEDPNEELSEQDMSALEALNVHVVRFQSALEYRYGGSWNNTDHEVRLGEEAIITSDMLGQEDGMRTMFTDQELGEAAQRYLRNINVMFSKAENTITSLDQQNFDLQERYNAMIDIVKEAEELGNEEEDLSSMNAYAYSANQIAEAAKQMKKDSDFAYKKYLEEEHRGTVLSPFGRLEELEPEEKNDVEKEAKKRQKKVRSTEIGMKILISSIQKNVEKIVSFFQAVQYIFLNKSMLAGDGDEFDEGKILSYMDFTTKQVGHQLEDVEKELISLGREFSIQSDRFDELKSQLEDAPDEAEEIEIKQQLQELSATVVRIQQQIMDNGFDRLQACAINLSTLVKLLATLTVEADEHGETLPKFARVFPEKVETYKEKIKTIETSILTGEQLAKIDELLSLADELLAEEV